VEVDDFSQEELSYLCNKVDTVVRRKRLQIVTRPPSKALQVFKVCTPEIVPYLTFQEALRLFQVCHTTRLWQRNGIASMVSRLIGRYFSNPRKMRDAMRRIGAVISGSSVLWLLDSLKDSWEAGDLDLYVPRNATQAMIDFLLEEGYQVVPEPEGEPHGGPYIDLGHLASVTKLVKGDIKIDLLESLSQSSVLPVAFFHSTAVMNYITADSIAMLYPKLTFLRIAVRCNPDRRSVSSWERKYSRRKFHLFSTSKVYSTFQDVLCKKLARKTGDDFCLFFNFGDADDKSGRDELSAEWNFVPDSQRGPHDYCTPSRCMVAHYHRNPVDEVGIEVISRATYS
jgi:hypothetical protein